MKNLIFVLICLFLAISCQAGTIYVDADASPGGDGSSWGTAYKYLQDGLADPCVLPDSEIWVAEGTYKPDANSSIPGGTGSRTATFQLINGVAIYGGFAGGETTLDERKWQTNKTIVSGEIGGGGNSDNSYHVVIGSGTDANAVLDGFTITAGNADGSDPYNKGGGMYNHEGSPTVSNCTFSVNWARGPSYAGGGMYNTASSPTVTNCTFIDNWAGEGGGMFNCDLSSPTVTNCTFSGNSAQAGAGGGMYNTASSPTVTNCTFSGSPANYGGGMYNESSSLTVTNCTFSGNSADYNGGGMFNSFGNPTVTNCIIWGNTAPTGPEIYNYSSSPTVTYSDVQGGWGGTGNKNADPLFVDADGPDNIVGTEDDNLRLSAGSPCIDAGDNTAVPAGVTTDLGGRLRFVDGDCNDTDIVDMGAYEFAFVYFGDLDGDCDVDFADFGYFANNWLVGVE